VAEKHPELFRRLQITVEKNKRWTLNDLRHNGGKYVSGEHGHTPKEIEEIEDRLKMPRLFNVSLII